MEQTINTLLAINIEIEGLLHVIKDRDADLAWEILAKKIAAFNDTYKQLLDAEEPQRTEDVKTNEEPVCQHYDEYQSQTATDADSTASTGLSAETTDNVFGDEAAEQVSEPVPEIVAEADEEDTTKSEDIATEEESPQTESCMTEQSDAGEKTVEERPYDYGYNDMQDAVPNASDGNTLRVDELLTRREALDLRRAFTLNDKFRYRRELFGSNDALFADTLDTLTAMTSLDEALDYLYNNLGWDQENDDVKDFVATVTNHFSAIK